MQCILAHAVKRWPLFCVVRSALPGGSKNPGNHAPRKCKLKREEWLCVAFPVQFRERGLSKGFKCHEGEAGGRCNKTIAINP